MDLILVGGGIVAAALVVWVLFLIFSRRD